MNELSRRDFFATMFTGVILTATGGRVLGRIVPRIVETPNPDIIQLEYEIDLSLPKYAALATEYSSISIAGTGLTLGTQVIVMRLPNDQFVAMENRCSHEAGVLGKFSKTAMVFTCSLHSAQYDEKGICKRGPEGGSPNLTPLNSFPVTYDKPNNKLYLNRITDVNEVQSDGYTVRCFPNPAFDDVVFEFGLDRDGVTSLNLYDEQGQFVTSIVSEVRAAGLQQIIFDVRSLASGVYTYHLKTSDGFETTRTLTVIH